MRGVTLVAGNAVTHVLGVLEKILLFARRVAAEAVRGIFLGAALERKNGMLLQRFRDLGVIAVSGLHGVGMRLSRPVASFASLNVFLAREGDFGMAGFAEFEYLVFVARAAALGAGKLTRWSVIHRRPGGDGGALQGSGPLLSESRAGGEDECNHKPSREEPPDSWARQANEQHFSHMNRYSFRKGGTAAFFEIGPDCWNKNLAIACNSARITTGVILEN